MEASDSRNAAIASWAQPVSWLSWLYCAGCFVVVCLGMPWTAGLSTVQVALIGGTLLVGSGLVMRFAPAELPAVSRIQLSLPILIAMGLLLRIGWVMVVPPVQISDMNEYLVAARNLIDGHGYFNIVGPHKLLAYRPPGEAFLLAGAMTLFGDNAWVPALINLPCYVASAWILHVIALQYAGARPAMLASLLFAVWPSHVMSTGLAFSEMPSALVWLAVLWCWLRAQSGERRWLIIGGLALGAGILIRPTFLLVPLMLGAMALSRREARWAAIRRAAVISLLAGVVVLPWTLRNVTHLGALVVVSSNGGDNLYRANNPLATGGFAPAGERSFQHLMSDEVRWNEESSAAAHEWIVNHPAQFLLLSLRKLGITLGADDTGAYWTLLRGHAIADGPYVAARVGSNAWWISVWAMVALALWRQRRLLTSTLPGLALLWFVLYFIVLHSVFESQPRYHMPAVGPLLILAALAFCPGTRAGYRSSSIES